ncbi:hypothetical protein VST7929_02129 [Vibrio stylophorae]|uniref:DUF4250 domain-containing protein n=1 Tax=Vibrio stylophorae TaxID=659351 RepID=A0ABM8ZV82_9VIBR|nr:DUF4250 domain-containing protein [Vibrio stylophorae]CAH0534216.1 hypothetical protein VST7929_02129 [Vibrio stylophorae]
MELDNYLTMDPIMLMSIVNMKLRDEFEDLDDLVAHYDLSKAKLITRLKAAGFEYLVDIKQFR